MVTRNFCLSKTDEIEQVLESLKTELGSFKVPEEKALDAQLVLCEALANSFTHCGSRKEKIFVEVSWTTNKKSLLINIKDNGCGFNYHEFLQKNEPEPFFETGRGVFLMSKILNKLWYNEKGNEVWGYLEW